MRKRLLALIAVMAIIGMACGGSSGEDTSAAFGVKKPDLCQGTPANTPGVTVLGQRLESISDLKVCVGADVKASVLPRLKNQPDCGDPCFTIEVEDFDVASDAKIVISYKRDGKDADPITYDPEPLGAGPETGRVCVVGVGSPDPCVERITTPDTLSVTAAKRKLNLSWGTSQDTGGAALAGYEIWRSTTGEPDTFLHWTSTTSTSFVDSGLAKGTTYYYFVVAYDGDGNHSEASNVATGTAK